MLHNLHLACPPAIPNPCTVEKFAKDHGLFLLGTGILENSMQTRIQARRAGRFNVGFRESMVLQNMLMDGNYKGFTISIYIEMYAQGIHRTPYTVLKMEIPSNLPAGLVMFRDKHIPTQGVAGGVREIQIGSPELDSLYTIQGTHPEAIVEFLFDKTVSHALIRLATFNETACLHDNSLSIKYRGQQRNRAILQQTLDELVSCASVLDAHARTYEDSWNLEPHLSTQPTSESSDQHEDMSNHW